MPPELALRRARLGWLASLAPIERAGLALGAVWLALILAFLRDWADMAHQWWDSSTYNHILLVPAIVGWMVWQRHDELRQLAPAPWWPALIPLAGAVLVWVLGAFAGFNLLRQIGAVALLPTSALLVLGPRLGAALAFPLAYLAFLVPFGDELVPPLQMITAFLTIGLTRISGIPAAIDGVFIDTPAGLFEVAEACSGVKFLIAMVALGAFAAHVGFRSWKRRIVFMAFAVAAPILANGVRAWGTIQAAQWVGADRATGFDHIFYGWAFFGVVIALVLGAAWRFFDRPAEDRFVDLARLSSSRLIARLERFRIAPAAGLALALAMVVAGQGWANAAERLLAPVPERIALPEVPGWRQVDYRPKAAWQPRARGAAHRLIGRYEDAQGRQVDVFLALYPTQGDGREAGGFGEGALPDDGTWSWASAGPAIANATTDRLLGPGRQMRVAETYYRTGILLTGSNTRLKLATIADRLALRARPTALLILSAEQQGETDPFPAIAEFRKATGPLDRWMDRIAMIR